MLFQLAMQINLDFHSKQCNIESFFLATSQIIIFFCKLLGHSYICKPDSVILWMLRCNKNVNLDDVWWRVVVCFAGYRFILAHSLCIVYYFNSVSMAEFALTSSKYGIFIDNIYQGRYNIYEYQLFGWSRCFEF